MLKCTVCGCDLDYTNTNYYDYVCDGCYEEDESYDDGEDEDDDE